MNGAVGIYGCTTANIGIDETNILFVTWCLVGEPRKFFAQS